MLNTNDYRTNDEGKLRIQLEQITGEIDAMQAALRGDQKDIATHVLVVSHDVMQIIDFCLDRGLLLCEFGPLISELSKALNAFSDVIETVYLTDSATEEEVELICDKGEIIKGIFRSISEMTDTAYNGVRDRNREKAFEEYISSVEEAGKIIEENKESCRELFRREGILDKIDITDLIFHSFHISYSQRLPFFDNAVDYEICYRYNGPYEWTCSASVEFMAFQDEKALERVRKTVEGYEGEHGVYIGCDSEYRSQYRNRWNVIVTSDKRILTPEEIGGIYNRLREGIGFVFRTVTSVSAEIYESGKARTFSYLQLFDLSPEEMEEEIAFDYFDSDQYRNRRAKDHDDSGKERNSEPKTYRGGLTYDPDDPINFEDTLDYTEILKLLEKYENETGENEEGEE